MQRTIRFLVAFLALAFIVFGSYLAINYAKGYRPSLATKTFEGTGLLAANSIPKGASVFINNKLTSATDDTLNLPPGEYQIKIAKDGYIPWEKTLVLEPELVTETNARLFPSVPNLKPLTSSGAINPLPSPDGQKILFSVNNATNNAKNGLYILDLLDRPLALNSQPRQISRLVNGDFSWSPDSSQILVSQPDSNFFLNSNSLNDLANIKDVTAQLPLIKKQWAEDLNKKQKEQIKLLPEFMQNLATSSASLISFSPDELKMLYLATQSAQIPENLIPPLPASSTQLQARQIKPGNYYVYDLEEDRNFLIAPYQENIPILWYPDSRHLITIEDSKIIILEYDATNRAVIYAGPFADNFVFPWPNGSQLIILASLNGGSNLPPNLYSINLK